MYTSKFPTIKISQKIYIYARSITTYAKSSQKLGKLGIVVVAGGGKKIASFG